MQKNWTENEIAVCLKLYRAGVSSSIISETIGRTQRSVKQFIVRKRKIDPDTWRIVERQPPKPRKANKTGKTKSQKCDTCYYASGAMKDGWTCPWVAPRFEPVPGWDATRVIYQTNNTASGKKIDYTYEIRDCPKYERG